MLLIRWCYYSYIIRRQIFAARLSTYRSPLVASISNRHRLLSVVRWAVVRILRSITVIKFYALEESEYNFPNRQPLKFPTKWFRVKARPMTPTAIYQYRQRRPPRHIGMQEKPFLLPPAPPPSWIQISFLVLVILPHLGYSASQKLNHSYKPTRRRRRSNGRTPQQHCVIILIPNQGSKMPAHHQKHKKHAALNYLHVSNLSLTRDKNYQKLSHPLCDRGPTLRPKGHGKYSNDVRPYSFHSMGAT